jgi:hypothetical protein
MVGEVSGFVLGLFVTAAPYLPPVLVACVALRLLWDWRRQRG